MVVLVPSGLRAQSDQAPSIAGSWIVTVPGNNGKPQRNLLTLSAGGGGMYVFAPGAPPGVMAWKQTGDRQFAFTLVTIAYDSDNNGNSSEVGTINIKGVGTLSGAGDTLTATVTADVLDLDGKWVVSRKSVSSAARVQVEPL